jgi:putative phosphoribosyl transferase
VAYARPIVLRRFHVHFTDRRHAGRELAAAVAHLAAERPVVLGLPRGGVVVAAEVARALEAPLDVVIVRKLGAPSQPEYAIGAIGEDGIVLVDDQVVDALRLRRHLPDLIEREQRELERRTARYRQGRPPADVRGRTVVLVDDGIATGSTARVAAEVLRLRGARRIVLAVPVGPADVAERFDATVDEIVCLTTPRGFRAVGAVYDSFEATSDEEVEELLRLPAGPDAPPAPAP